jgi:ABC-type sugar transport system permease subunit/ABC-type glycerol-3-phosphate transport system substrate-binding protein
MHRRFPSLLSLVALCLLAVSSPVAAAVTLKLDRLPLKDSPDPWDRAMRAVVERFEQLHPEVHCQPWTPIKVEGPAGESPLLMAMAGGAAPDVMYVNFRQLENYVKQGFLYPLDEYVERWKREEDLSERIHPQIWNVVTVKGHVYSIPYFQCVMALYYRKDLFRAAGLDPNKPPRTWDEFYEYAKRLTIPEKGQWGFGFYGTPQGTAWHWVNFLWQAGGEVVERGPDGRWRAVFNTPEGVKALEFYRKLVAGPWERDGKTYYGVALRSPTLKQAIEDDKIAMFMNYQFDLLTNRSNINPAQLGIAALPAGPAGKANEINAGMWGINSQIRDRATRDAAWEYIKFMGSEEADRIRTLMYVEAGMGRFVNPKYLKRFGYWEDFKYDIPKGWAEANEEAFKHGRPEPYGENCQMIYTELDTPLDQARLSPGADASKLLDDAARRVNEKLLGFTPAPVLERRRLLAAQGLVLVALLCFGGGGTVLWRQRRRTTAARETGEAGPRIGWTRLLAAGLFMLPALLSILVWAYYPLARGSVMAFQDYRVLGGSQWVGLDNFIEVVWNDTFRTAVWNTLLYVALTLGMGFFVPIALALALSEVPRGKYLFRTLYYLPAVTSGIIVIILWKWFYDPSPNGLLNSLITPLNALVPVINTIFVMPLDWLAGLFGGNVARVTALAPQAWLEDPDSAMIALIIPGIWAGAGPGSVIYLAALKSVPEETYEAADLDGAGVWAKIRHITVPTLRPLIIINLVGAFIGAFQAAQNVLVMTGGGPVYRTHTLGLEIFYNAFMYLKFGYATAAAWIMAAMLVGFTLYQLRMLRNLRFSAAPGR